MENRWSSCHCQVIIDSHISIDVSNVISSRRTFNGTNKPQQISTGTVVLTSKPKITIESQRRARGLRNRARSGPIDPPGPINLRPAAGGVNEILRSERNAVRPRVLHPSMKNLSRSKARAASSPSVSLVTRNRGIHRVPGAAASPPRRAALRFSFAIGGSVNTLAGRDRLNTTNSRPFVRHVHPRFPARTRCTRNTLASSTGPPNYRAGYVCWVARSLRSPVCRAVAVPSADLTVQRCSNVILSSWGIGDGVEDDDSC